MEKSITVQVASKMHTTLSYVEYEFPILNKYLTSGWTIKAVHQIATNINVGFVYLTFELYLRE